MPEPRGPCFRGRSPLVAQGALAAAGGAARERGALLLFAAVQLTMIGASLRAGERPRPLEWAGLGVSLAGLVLLTRPGLSRPDPAGAVLMLAAGAAWGVYSLRGRGAADAVATNAASFVRAVPFALATSAAFGLLGTTHLTFAGALLAPASGGLTSGLGYAVWYAAMRGLSATRAAIVQLSVPPLAALGGALTLGETVSLRLVRHREPCCLPHIRS